MKLSGTPNTPGLLKVDQQILDSETFLHLNRENTLMKYHSSFPPPLLNWH